MDSSISYASLSALPPETNYIQIVNYIMYFCWVNKILELELEGSERKMDNHFCMSYWTQLSWIGPGFIAPFGTWPSLGVLDYMQVSTCQCISYKYTYVERKLVIVDGGTKYVLNHQLDVTIWLTNSTIWLTIWLIHLLMPEKRGVKYYRNISSVVSYNVFGHPIWLVQNSGFDIYICTKTAMNAI